jgi:hypothetical protein
MLTLFISNVDRRVHNKLFRDTFENKFGPIDVTGTTLALDYSNGGHKKFGHVLFLDEESAHEALAMEQISFLNDGSDKSYIAVAKSKSRIRSNNNNNDSNYNANNYNANNYNANNYNANNANNANNHIYDEDKENYNYEAAEEYKCGNCTIHNKCMNCVDDEEAEAEAEAEEDEDEDEDEPEVEPVDDDGTINAIDAMEALRIETVQARSEVLSARLDLKRAAAKMSKMQAEHEARIGKLESIVGKMSGALGKLTPLLS